MPHPMDRFNKRRSRDERQAVAALQSLGGEATAMQILPKIREMFGGLGEGIPTWEQLEGALMRLMLQKRFYLRTRKTGPWTWVIAEVRLERNEGCEAASQSEDESWSQE